jgi:hypothetical protein
MSNLFRINVNKTHLPGDGHQILGSQALLDTFARDLCLIASSFAALSPATRQLKINHSVMLSAVSMVLQASNPTIADQTSTSMTMLPPLPLPQFAVEPALGDEPLTLKCTEWSALRDNSVLSVLPRMKELEQILYNFASYTPSAFMKHQLHCKFY